MEANRKREGSFLKRKLVKSLYGSRTAGAAKPANASANSSTIYSTSKAMKPLSPSASMVGFIVNRQEVHDYTMMPQPRQGIVSFIAAPESGATRDSYGKFAAAAAAEKHLYGGIEADESVDLRAASYISCVQERFRRE